MLLIATITAVTAQTKEYTPYLNAGSSIQNNVLNYGGELGINSNTSRYALTINSTTQSPENVWSIGAKGYWGITDKKTVNTVEGFVYTGVSMALKRQHPLTIEPGVSAIWNITKQFAPQVSLGFPIAQNSVLRSRPLGIVAGISLNYQIN